MFNFSRDQWLRCQAAAQHIRMTTLIVTGNLTPDEEHMVYVILIPFFRELLEQYHAALPDEPRPGPTSPQAPKA